MSTSNMQQAALGYNQNHYLIFPVHGIVGGRCTCGDLHESNPGSVGKHPATPRGFQDASDSMAQVMNWWPNGAEYNIGLPTGSTNGLFVVDIEHDGLEDFARLIAEHGEIPPTYLVESGGGGRHYYFRLPEDVVVRNKTGLAGLRVDCRGEGGYIIAPPSAHRSGRRYQVLDAPPLADAPGWIIEFVTQSGRFAKRAAALPASSPTRPAVAGERREQTPPDIIERARRYIATIPGAVSGQGGHNQALRVAIVLVRGFNLTQEEAYALISDWSQTCQPPWSERELRHKLSEADRDDRAWGPRGHFLNDNTGFHLTDLGNTLRFVARYGDDLRYCSRWKQWMVWDGCCWRKDETNEVIRRAKQTVLSMYVAASQMADDDRRRNLIKHAQQSESKERLMAMVKLAESESGIAVSPDVFDTQPWLINVNNGTIDLQTGQLRAHDRLDLMTQITPIDYDSQAKCPHWDQFLTVVFRRDSDIIHFIRRWIGVCLTGTVREQYLLILYGTGSNGKSVFLKILSSLLDAYAIKGSQELLVTRGGDSHPTTRMDLVGKRLCICSETDDGHRLKESMIKDLTGGENIRGRRICENTWEYSPTHKIILATNHKPIIKGNDQAIWRRLLLLSFGVHFWDADRREQGAPELQADKTLYDRLRNELPGILAWAVRGCLEWQQDGLQIPQSVLDASEAYRTEQDILGRFITEETIEATGHRTRSTSLYKRYETWCEDNGHNAMSQTRFSPALEERGLQKGRDREGIYFKDINLSDPYHRNGHLIAATRSPTPAFLNSGTNS